MRIIHHFPREPSVCFMLLSTFFGKGCVCFCFCTSHPPLPSLGDPIALTMPEPVAEWRSCQISLRLEVPRKPSVDRIPKYPKNQVIRRMPLVQHTQWASSGPAPAVAVGGGEWEIEIRSQGSTGLVTDLYAVDTAMRVYYLMKIKNWFKQKKCSCHILSRFSRGILISSDLFYCSFIFPYQVISILL